MQAAAATCTTETLINEMLMPVLFTQAGVTFMKQLYF